MRNMAPQHTAKTNIPEFHAALCNQFSSLPASLWWLTSLPLAKQDSDAMYITITSIVLGNMNAIEWLVLLIVWKSDISNAWKQHTAVLSQMEAGSLSFLRGGFPSVLLKYVIKEYNLTMNKFNVKIVDCSYMFRPPKRNHYPINVMH
jgi:hypothetical protein